MLSFQIWVFDNNTFRMIKKFRQKWLVISQNLSEKKNPPRAQIFRYFRIESRNNKTARIKAKLWMSRLLFKGYEAVKTWKKWK